MAFRSDSLIATSTPIVIKMLFLLVVLFSISKQFNALLAYSNHSLLLTTVPVTVPDTNESQRTLAKEIIRLDPIPLPNNKEDEMIETIESENILKNVTQVASPDDDNGLAFEDDESEELASSELKKILPNLTDGLVNRVASNTLSKIEKGNHEVDLVKTRKRRSRIKKDEHEDDIHRAMFVISMGKKAAKTKIIERFVYSARNIGKFSGYIVVLTDAPKDRYDGMKNWAEKVIIMQPKEEDLKMHYVVSGMIYKRFKTLAVEYMERDSRLHKVELIYYLDADIVFGNNMNKAFNGMETTYGIGRLGANSTKFSLGGRGEMWMFKGNVDKWKIQGGQMILDRQKSQPCLERWRRGFDDETTSKIGKDQYLLMEIKAEMDQARKATMNQKHSINNTALECEIVIMEQKPYIEFPLVKDIKKRSKHLYDDPNHQYTYSPMVHVRNDGGTATMKEKYIRPYMQNLLGFKPKQKDPLGILKKVRMETT